MNTVDLLLVGLLVLAVLGGLRVGLVARVLTWAGLAVGVILAFVTVPLGLRVVDVGSPTTRLFVGLLVLVATVTVTSTIFQSLGARARARLGTTPLSGLDRVAGALAGAAAVIAVVWFLLPAAADVPGGVAREVRGSALVAVLRDATPPPPNAARAVRSLIATSRFPEVFADLQPTPVTSPPPEDIPVAQDVVERATASTVNVEATGCGRRYEGSGVTVRPGTVVTNAHVVAGADEVVLRQPDGRSHDGVVIVFDADRDLAVIESSDLGQEPLDLATTEPEAEGVVIGYPGGQDTPRVAPIRVEQQRTALGRDIYGERPTEREVLFLSAELQQGDSGSPVIDSDGRVTGIVFAISPDVATTAYALDLPEVEAVLDAPREPGETGRCLR